jgi:hypothetical protein
MAEGGGLQLAEAVGYKDGGVLVARGRERVHPVRTMVLHRADLCPWKACGQVSHSGAGPRCHAGEAANTRCHPVPARRVEQLAGNLGERTEVAVGLKVVAHRSDLFGYEVVVGQQPRDGPSGVLLRVFVPDEPFLLGESHQVPVHDQCGGRVVGVGAQSEHC